MVVSIYVLRQLPVVSRVCQRMRLPVNLVMGRTIGPTGISSHVSGIHLDVIVPLQPSVGIIHALDRAGKEVERGGPLVLRDWGGFQLVVPRIGESGRTIRRERLVRDGFTERGEREIEFRGNRLEEFGVDVDDFKERAEIPG